MFFSLWSMMVRAKILILTAAAHRRGQPYRYVNGQNRNTVQSSKTNIPFDFSFVNGVDLLLLSFFDINRNYVEDIRHCSEHRVNLFCFLASPQNINPKHTGVDG
jgi:hypothetical protein